MLLMGTYSETLGAGKSLHIPEKFAKELHGVNLIGIYDTDKHVLTVCTEEDFREYIGMDYEGIPVE